MLILRPIFIISLLATTFSIHCNAEVVLLKLEAAAPEGKGSLGNFNVSVEDGSKIDKMIDELLGTRKLSKGSVADEKLTLTPGSR